MTNPNASNKTRQSTPVLALALVATIFSSNFLWGIESEVGKAFEAFEIASIENRSTKAMVQAANRFLKNIDPIFTPKAKLPFNTPEKAVWSNLPPNIDYAGIRIADLNDSELRHLVTLLATSLSPNGFEKVRGIMLGDDLLVRGDQTGNRMLFGADNYWFFIYGSPGEDEAWGWQFDGHHLAINLTIGKDEVTISPSFIGTQPADVQWGKTYKSSPMEGEVSHAFELINSLSPDMRAKAVVGERRQNLDAGPGADDVTPSHQGIKAVQFNENQKSILNELITEWTSILPRKYAQKRQSEINTSLDETYFGWWGKTETGSAVYFRVQGPKVLIEFANQNLGGDPLQHLHSIFRDPSNDYGSQFK